MLRPRVKASVNLRNFPFFMCRLLLPSHARVRASSNSKNLLYARIEGLDNSEDLGLHSLRIALEELES